MVGSSYFILPTFTSFELFLLICIIAFLSSFGTILCLVFWLFFITDIWGIVDSQAQVINFLSGKMLPLTATAILTPLTYLPFAYFYHHPMQIYFGKYDFNQTILVFAGGIG